jgi:inhibitor of KinA sporulation pathway (predicted exonuclease)
MGLVILWAHNSHIQAPNEELQSEKIYHLRIKLSNVALHISIQCHLAHVSLILVVRGQIVNLILNHSFGHNLNFKSPNGKCKPTFNINVLKKFNGLKKCQFGEGLLFSFFFQKFGTFMKFQLPKSKSAWKCWDSFALSHTCRKVFEP